MRGIRIVWSGERNFRAQAIIGFLTIVGAYVLDFSYEEVAVMLLCVGMVLSGEMLNTVLEEVLDVIAPHYSEHVGRVKDIAAGVVLLFSSFAFLIGLVTILHHFFV